MPLLKMKRTHQSLSSKQLLTNEWEALLKRHSKPLERGAIAKGIRNVKLKNGDKNLEVLNQIKSLVTPGGDTALPAKKVYTGDKILGIATMHKSNLVPIFNDQAAIEVAQMRRN